MKTTHPQFPECGWVVLSKTPVAQATGVFNGDDVFYSQPASSDSVFLGRTSNALKASRAGMSL